MSEPKPESMTAEEVDCEDWLIRNLPSTPAFRCPDCGRKGADCCSATFMRPEGPSLAYCMDCLWVLAEKHLTPLEDVTNG